MAHKLDTLLATEAKGIVAMAFRNGPLENVHAGATCPTCSGKPEYSHITQAEMRQIMKHAVDMMYAFLWLRENDLPGYMAMAGLGANYTHSWDDPDPKQLEGYLSLELVRASKEEIAKYPPFKRIAAHRKKRR